MHHQYFNFFAGEGIYFRVNSADILSVDISVNAFQGFKGSQLFSKSNISKVARMPDLIAFFKIAEDLFIQKAVGI